MEIIETLDDFRLARNKLCGSVGVVLTMGALHEGHLALVEQAEAENDSVIVTIFVNPTQFNNPADLAAYPRDLTTDAAMLKQRNVSLLFAPPAAQMYPPDFQTYVTVEEKSAGLEGDHRPGHFRGVTTIVAKLFHLTLPDRVYFGQKDAQQVAVIRQMLKDLNFPLEVVVCPTVRAEDGLALSSRNQNLLPAERQAAPVLYRALQTARTAYLAGERDPDALCETVAQTLAEEPLARVEYIAVTDAESLQALSGPIQNPALISLAVHLGKTRLIDNIILPD